MIFVVFMMTTVKPKHVVTSRTNQAQTMMSVITVSLTDNEVIFPTVYDVFEFRREFEARAGLDAGFVLCFVCLLS
jgi:hypothetical protein